MSTATAVATAPLLPDLSAPRLPATPTRSAPTASPTVGRGLTTDYGYVISELRRIFVLTAGILVLLVLVWLLLR